MLVLLWIAACGAWLLGIKLLQERNERILWIVIGLSCLLVTAWLLATMVPDR